MSDPLVLARVAQDAEPLLREALRRALLAEPRVSHTGHPANIGPPCTECEYVDRLSQCVASFRTSAPALARAVQEMAAEVERLRGALDLLIGTIKAHETRSLECDRGGDEYCDCLAKNVEIASRAAAQDRQP